MTVVAFSMSGLPRGKGRPRVFVQAGRSIATTDPKTRRYEASVTAVARATMGGRSPLVGPLSVSLRFRLPIPASATKATKAGMAAGEIAPVTKPDLDNMAKAILDAIGEDAAMKRKGQKEAARVAFRNDSQIVRLFVTKIYSAKPGLDVRVEALDAQEPQA